MRVQQSLLAFNPQLIQQDMPGIAKQLPIVHGQ